MAIKFLNTVQVDTDVLYVDAVNNRVGIGTASPSAKLDVDGVIRSRGGTYVADIDTKTDVGLIIPENYFIYTADGSSYLRKLIGKSSDIIKIGEAGTSLIDGINLMPGTSGGYVQIFNNSSIAAKFVDGKLGIGTTAPLNKLHVDGAVRATSGVYFNSTTSVGFKIQNDSASNELDIYGGSIVPGITIDNSGHLTLGNYGLSGSGTPTKFLGLDSNSKLVTYTSGSSLPGGPYLPLSAGSSYPLTNSLYIGASGANGLILKQDTSAGSNSGRLFFQTDTAIEGVCIMNANGALSFRTSSDPGATSGNTKMVLTNSGNVGIGTTSPDSKLNIEGAKNTAILTLGNTTSGSSWAVGDRVGGIDFYSADGSGGGIGVKASISYEDALGGTGSSQAMVFRTGGNTSGTNNVERMRLQYNGNVGIGTTSPSANLEVQGTNSNTQAALKVTDSGDSFFEVVPDNNTTFKIGDLDAVGDEAMIVGTFSDITFSKGGTTTMILDSNNRVGIGTTSPGTKLEVNGGLRASNLQLFSGGTQYLNVSLYSGDPWINTAVNNGTINIGAPAANTTNVYVQGTIENRDGLLGFVPTFVHGGFYHSSSSSSSAIYWIPSNYISETTGTQYYNRFVAPYAGRVKKVIMRWTNGTTPTATSVTFRKTQNGSVSSTQFPATVTGGATTSMVATKEFSNTDFTFNAGDKYGIGFMTNGGTRFLYGMTYTLVIEYDI